MKKVVVALIAALAIAAVLATGCGSGKSTSTPTAGGKAQSILKANQVKMQGVKSFKINGTYTVTTPSAEVKTESATFTGEVQMVSANDARAHVTATPSGGGKPSEIYVADGFQYTYDPNKGWSKSKVGSASDLTSSGIITPSSISELTKYAENMKLGPVQNGKYVLTFDIGSKFFDQVFKQAAQGSQSSAPTGTAAQSAQQLAQAMKELLSGLTMSMTYKIDQTSGLADGASIKVSLKGSALGDATADISMTFSDYNAPVTITLPPEAQNAPEKQTGPGGIPSLPNLPGL